MKKLLCVLILTLYLTCGYSQSVVPYNPALHTVTNKAIGVAQANPVDARSFYFDAPTYRPFKDTGEVKAYLNIPKNRVGGFSIFVREGGTLSGTTFTGGVLNEYWFRNGTADSNLILKTSDLSNYYVKAQINNLIHVADSSRKADSTVIRAALAAEITARIAGDAGGGGGGADLTNYYNRDQLDSFVVAKMDSFYASNAIGFNSGQFTGNGTDSSLVRIKDNIIALDGRSATFDSFLLSPRIVGSTNNNQGITFMATSGNNSSTGAKFTWAGGNAGNTPFMTMNNGGALGLGTTSPARRLHLNDTFPVVRFSGATGSSITYDFGVIQPTLSHLQIQRGDASNSAAQFGIYPKGVGFNTGEGKFLSSTLVLAGSDEIADAVNREDLRLEAWQGGGYGIYSGYNGTGLPRKIIMDATRSIRSAKKQIVQDTTGYVGINTLTPTARFEVNGAVKLDSVGTGSSSHDVLVVDGTGLVKKVTQASIASGSTSLSGVPITVIAHHGYGQVDSVTGTTGETTLFTGTFAGGLVGNNGYIEIIWQASWTNSAGQKNFRVKLNGVTVSQATNTTNVSGKYYTILYAVNSLTDLEYIGQVQGGGNLGFSGSGNSGPAHPASQNTAATTTVTVTCANTVTSDVAHLESIIVRTTYLDTAP